jgi:hypothetical protein
MKHDSNEFFTWSFLRHVDKVKIYGKSIELFDYQVELVETVIHDTNRLVVSSDRKMGMSTLLVLLSHWTCSSWNDKNILFLSTTESLRHCKEMFDQIGPITTSSKIKFANRTMDWIGSTFNFVIVDNAAFIDDLEGKWTNINKNQDSVVIINSTPTGDHNWFQSIWERTSYKKIALPRTKHPFYNKLTGEIDNTKLFV